MAMRRGALPTAWIVIMLLGGCNFPGPQPAEPTALPPTPMPPAATATPPPEPSPTLDSATPTSEATAPPVSGAQPAEALLILEPGPDSARRHQHRAAQLGADDQRWNAARAGDCDGLVRADPVDRAARRRWKRDVISISDRQCAGFGCTRAV